MALFTKDTIDRVRDAVDMVQLVGAKTDLRRVGTRWSGLCPFHDERTPSFSVNPEQKLYHCFGCGEGGDAIRFVMETEALDFPAAVEALAERYGVQVEREEDDPQAEERRRRRERLLRAARPRRELLRGLPLGVGRGGQGARVPRLTRAVGGDPARVPGRLRTERLGPDAARRAPGRVQRGGAGGGRARAARPRGLALRPLPRADHVPARRRARAGARLRRPQAGGGAGPEVPQHLGERASTARAGSCSASTGRGNSRPRAVGSWSWRVIRTSWRSIRLEFARRWRSWAPRSRGDQMLELERVAPRLMLALDADRSGQEAMLRAARIAEDRGLELQVVEMPEGTDPADFVTSNGVARVPAS